MGLKIQFITRHLFFPAGADSHHFVVTFDAVNDSRSVLRIYRDGLLKYTDNAIPALAQDIRPENVMLPASRSPLFAGRMHGLKIFPQSADQNLVNWLFGVPEGHMLQALLPEMSLQFNLVGCDICVINSDDGQPFAARLRLDPDPCPSSHAITPEPEPEDLSGSGSGSFLSGSGSGSFLSGSGSGSFLSGSGSGEMAAEPTPASVVPVLPEPPAPVIVFPRKNPGADELYRLYTDVLSAL